MKTLLTITSLCAALATHSVAQQKPAEYLSLKLEMKHAIKQGNEFLKAKQTDEGYWGDAETPALTALALAAALRDPNLDLAGDDLPDYLVKGYDWLTSTQQDDGGFYVKGLATYNTSAAIMGLLARGREKDEPAILKARAFLINLQTDWGDKGETDSKYDGGIGYGGTYPHSDMSNTYLALEALKASEHLAKDGKHGEQPTLNWDAALTFVSRCQNLPETNDTGIATDDEEKGGFVYFPGDSKAGEKKLDDGRVALRSYGSMSYAGLLSLVYADLDQDDPRVVAVLDWLGRNFTLEENPGLGLQGLYYYYHAMTKSLVAARIDQLNLDDGSNADWRRALATKLVSTQNTDGSWVNENSRWWENDPLLVTTYVVMTLEQIYYSIPD